jgi:hypothetical protein
MSVLVLCKCVILLLFGKVKAGGPYLNVKKALC